ncbi:Hsp20/alpha crystallin family protein [Aspergillus ruber CBS 135680]|uniref:Heat-shock protein n=1 Tax=Aspergillus ruber (strain CBS 135680) TaxID=1388766 RepID=A0A017S966_ASPRC|nr:heat-shock protein [Aspergillus ruber CBS 135680]EYE93492.1 heat-shock protein [Aspergillus ruber CBS 135680]
MAFFPHYTTNLSPLLYLLDDDYDVHRSTSPEHNHHHKQCHNYRQPFPVRYFSPNFDLQEVNEAYYLDGELPGVDPNHVDIGFSDSQTLVIKGRVERNYNMVGESQQYEGQSSEVSSNKSYQPTVEDEDEANYSSPVATPTYSEKSAAEKAQKPAYKYRHSERAIGEFHRVFNLPTRVDQDTVRASLRNGVLSLVLPKEPTPKMKKIRIE